MWPWTAKKQLVDILEEALEQIRLQGDRIASLEESDAQRAAVFLATNDVLKRTLARWAKREEREHGQERQRTAGAEAVQTAAETQGESAFEKAQRRILARRTARAAQGLGAIFGADDGNAQSARPDDE